MIIVKEKTIMCSRGDTFITLFYVKGLVLTENDRAVFTVKKDIEGRQTLLSLPCGIDTLNNVISVFGTAQESGAHTTLVYPNKFIVRRTVHND